MKKSLYNEKIFLYKKDGYYFRTGIFSTKPIVEMYFENSDYIDDLLDKIYEDGNRLTRYIVKDVKKEINDRSIY